DVQTTFGVDAHPIPTGGALQRREIPLIFRGAIRLDIKRDDRPAIGEIKRLLIPAQRHPVRSHVLPGDEAHVAGGVDEIGSCVVGEKRGPLESATTSPIRQKVLSPNLLARTDRVGCRTTSSAASLHSAGRPPGSEHVLSAPMRRPLLSYASAPVPWVSLTKIENLSFGSSMPTVLGCSCANSSPPSFVPMMPSALSGPCQTSFHLAPAAITPGIPVTVTSFAAVGCGKGFRCCAPASAPNERAIANATVNFIGSLPCSN